MEFAMEGDSVGVLAVFPDDFEHLSISCRVAPHDHWALVAAGAGDQRDGNEPVVVRLQPEDRGEVAIDARKVRCIYVVQECAAFARQHGLFGCC